MLDTVSHWILRTTLCAYCHEETEVKGPSPRSHREDGAGLPTSVLLVTTLQLLPCESCVVTEQMYDLESPRHCRVQLCGWDIAENPSIKLNQ